MSIFQFKQFNIQQNQSSMKVGTDSILLGSWVSLTDEVRLLDIGTGTGILALMLAQRSNAETIDAIEIGAIAFEEAVDNFENSPWADRLFCYHTSIQNFAEEANTYDLIIANPPYFEPSELSDNHDRNMARQTFELGHHELLQVTKKLLSKDGSCAFVIPYEIEIYFVKLANEIELFPFRILHTKDTETSAYKRSFLQFNGQQTSCKTNELVLKNEDKSYSNAFIELTKEFYRDF